MSAAKGFDHVPGGKYEDASDNFSSVKGPRNKYVIACAVLASMNSILLGYDVGVMSGVVIYLKKNLHISDVEEEMLIGSLNIISIVGAAIAGRTSDAIGRRWTMALAAFIFLLGALVMSLAPSFGVLLGGRLLSGIGVGFALLIAPVYTAEVSPASSRGALTSLPEVFINVGILVGYVSNIAFSHLPAHINWRLMLGVGALPSIFLGCGVLCMPESPRWLVMRNRNDEAKVVLDRTSDSPAEAAARLSEIIEGLHAHQEVPESSYPAQDGRLDEATWKSKGEGSWRELYRPIPPVRRMLVLALGIQFFQQATGIDATVYYSPTIFKKAGIRTDTGLLIATIAVGVAKAGCVLIATFLLDRVGRRPLLLTSTLGMIASLLTLASSVFFVGENKSRGRSHEGAAFIAILSACFNVAFFSIGWGPICWVLTSEVFPLRLRAKAGSLGVMVNRFVSGVVSISFLSVSKALTVGGTFFLFAGVSVLAATFVYTYVPETKGKTLEAIVEFFHGQCSEKIPARLKSVELGDREYTSQTLPNPNPVTTPSMDATQIPKPQSHLSPTTVEHGLLSN